MPEELLVRHCSPTLAGLKTANMFSCDFENESHMKNSVRRLNRIFIRKGLRIIPLKYNENRALLYVYRPSKLSEDLKHITACKLLEQLGYKDETPERCIVYLINRLEICDEFPHEIGLFLGYPPEDVCGFIKNKADKCKCTGCWKVYGDEENARKTFNKYKKCSRIYYEQWKKGISIERLTVAV